MRHTLRLLIAIFLLATARLAAADVAAEIRAHEEAFGKACNAGDTSAALALYTDDARVVWPGAGEEAHGRDAIQKVLASGCKGARLTLRDVDTIAIDDTHVVTVGHWESAVTPPSGRAMTLQVRTTEVLVKQGGSWKYLVDHASVGLPAPPARRPEARRTERRR